MDEAFFAVQSMVRSSPDCMAAIDAKANILALSASFAQAMFQRTGWRPQAGLSARDLTSAWPEMDGVWHDALDRGLAGQAVRQALGDMAEVFLTPMPGGGALVTLRIVDSVADRYRETFETAIIGLANLSMDGRWLRVNRRYCEILGYESRELAGKTCLDVTHPDDLDEGARTVACMCSGEIDQSSYEKRYRRKTGEDVWAAVTLQKHAEAGRTPYLIATAVDITDRKRAEQRLRDSERRFEMMMRRGGTGAFVLDRNLVYTWIHTCQIGFTADELVGRRLRDVYDAESGALLEGLYGAAIASGQGFRKDVRLQSLGKAEPQFFDLIAEPLRDCGGEVVGLTCVATDVTERVNAQSAVETARAEAERANDAKTRFLAAASHDLRQPIQALRLLLHLLTEKAMEGDQLRLCSRMGEALASTEAMLAGLMEFATIESGQVKVAPAPLRLDVLLKRIGGEVADAAARKGLSLHVRAMPGATVSDPMLLERMIRNLLVNAVRYTERGSILLALRRRGDTYHIEVRDSGCGIAVERQTEVFEEFRQLTNPERDRSKGVGLGLAIVARTADLLGHQILLASRAGRGSVFSVVVPCLSPPWPAALAEDAPADAVADGGRWRVLLVEDDPIQLMALEALLDDAGFVVAAAGEAAEAEGLIDGAGIVPDIILSDYRLPGGVSGLQVIAMVRERLGRFIPAILLTGDTQTSIVEQSAGAGCATLHKPYTPTELIEAIGTLLRMQE